MVPKAYPLRIESSVATGTTTTATMALELMRSAKPPTSQARTKFSK
jgi:hypothetical protein